MVGLKFLDEEACIKALFYYGHCDQADEGKQVVYGWKYARNFPEIVSQTII